MDKWYDLRLQAVTLYKAGLKAKAIAQRLGCSETWVRKWWRRYEQSGTAGLREQSRAPKKPRCTATAVREAVIRARLELEARANQAVGLKYIGGPAVRTRLKQQACTPLPSVPTIERILRDAGLTRPREEPVADQVSYPHLKPDAPHQLLQVDIVPHYLTGGQRVACFNAIDVVSRFPTGQASQQRRARDAAAFLVHAWQTVGISRYTQVDNEGCFSGGATHPHVLGQVLRLALQVGTELVFSPVGHPQSNGFVERFHQEYNRHVWQDTYLEDIPTVNAQAATFFQLYRHSQHHKRLAEQSPHHIHSQPAARYLSPHFRLSEKKLPLYAGVVHFMRQVQPDGSIRVLNVAWAANAPVGSGVWATLSLTPDGASLHIYDGAPDQAERRCLAVHPFPLSEAVHPAPAIHPLDGLPSDSAQDNKRLTDRPSSSALADAFFKQALRLLQKPLIKTLELTNQLLE